MSHSGRPLLARTTPGGSPNRNTHPEPTHTKPKRVLIESACAACRKRKSKCDGQRPSCSRCLYLSTDCLYQAEEGQSRWSALKKKNELLEREIASNQELHAFLQSRPEPEAQEIFQRLRSGPYEALPSVLRQVKDGEFMVHPVGLTGPSNTRLPPIRSVVDIPSYSGQQSQGFDRQGSRGTDPESQGVSPQSTRSRTSSPDPANLPLTYLRPEYNVSAGFWTKVTSSDQLVSHLLSLYFQWEHPVHNLFDKGLFLEDLAARRTTFCSELLVNSILTLACTYSPLLKHEVEPWNNHSLQMAFHKESRRLWERGEGKDDLTTMVSAFLITCELNKMSKDKIGLSFQMYGLRMAKDLGLFRVAPTLAAARPPPGVTPENWGRARRVASWAAFNWQILTTFTYQSAPLLASQPPIPIPDHGQQDQNPAVFQAFCRLSVIQNEVGLALYGADGWLSGFHPSPERAEILYNRLLAFHESLPGSLSVQEHRENEIFIIHMQYYTVIIRLFKPFLAATRDAPESVRMYRDCARANTIAAGRNLWQLLEVYLSLYNFDACSCNVTQLLLVAAYTALDELLPGEASSMLEPEEVYRAFILCIEGLRAIGDRLYFAQPVLRTIAMTLRKQPLEISKRVREILSAYDDDDWIINASKNIHSQYAADWRGDRDLDSIRLDNLIQEWKELAAVERRWPSGFEDGATSPSSLGG